MAKLANEVSGVTRPVAVCLAPPGIVTQQPSLTLQEFLTTVDDDLVLLEAMKRLTIVLGQLHGQGYVYNSLQLQNVGVSKEDTSVTLIEFEFLTKVGEPGPHYGEITGGTKHRKPEKVRNNSYPWCAPELYHEGRASHASDVYALCTILGQALDKLTKKPGAALVELAGRGVLDDVGDRPQLGKILSSLKNELEFRDPPSPKLGLRDKLTLKLNSWKTRIKMYLARFEKSTPTPPLTYWT